MFSVLSAVWLFAARTLKKSGYYEEALKAYSKVIEIAPKNIEAWQDKIYILETLERYEEARELQAKHGTSR